MTYGCFELIVVIPTFVKGFKNVSELPLRESVQMGDDGIEFLDHLLFFIFFQLPIIHSHGPCPFCEAPVGTCKSSSDFNCPLPKNSISVWPRNWKWVQDV